MIQVQTHFWKTLPVGDLISLALILLTFSKSSQIGPSSSNRLESIARLSPPGVEQLGEAVPPARRLRQGARLAEDGLPARMRSRDAAVRQRPLQVAQGNSELLLQPRLTPLRLCEETRTLVSVETPRGNLRAGPPRLVDKNTSSCQFREDTRGIWGEGSDDFPLASDLQPIIS